MKNRMNRSSTSGRIIVWAAVLGCVVSWAGAAQAQPVTASGVTNEIRIVELQGTVEVSLAGATTWVLTRTNQVLHPLDRLRTAANSRVALRWSEQSVVTFGASTELEILPPHSPEAESGLHLIRGIVSFFHRGTAGRMRVVTRGAVAGVEGTEFVVVVTSGDVVERTILSVIDGRVRFGNEFGEMVLANGEQAVAEVGRAPVRTAGFLANNVLQWCFYYPGVLDLADLPFTPREEEILWASIAAYRTGDLLAALASYPATRVPDSDGERVYHAALLLSVGQVEQVETLLASVPSGNASSRLARLVTALRQLISAVRRQPSRSVLDPELATEFLAASYGEQSHAVRGTSLERALTLARRAADVSPRFGFAWARVAELEFSFGHTANALDALDKSLALMPRNAQALALKGFLLAARNHTREAVTWFNRALEKDSALGNAWLGRGLCRIRLGDAAGGREDLLVAAALEPQRAALRSYLGKADANAGDYRRAVKELQLAERLDPNDPTAWLYSALLNQERNRVNAGIRDMERSRALNDNRSVYRSHLLLDQDRAVRSANLAALYRDAGMSDVAAREAARAVNYNYGNYSAHLFLANSYEALRDPNLINLRYETASQNEYLLANLLAPPGAGPLSSRISQQEYARLFERDRLGVVSSSEYLSRGGWTESGAQFGTFGMFSYEVGAFYRSDLGERPNNDIVERQLTFTLRQQLTPQDTVYLRLEDFEGEGGDLAQYYDPRQASPGVRYRETQEPIVGLGYHHEWSPGVHTLLFVTRLDDTSSFTNSSQPTLLAVRPDVDPIGLPGVTELVGVYGLTMHEQFANRLEIYSGELQQIWQQPQHNTVVGLRAQSGHFHTSSLQLDPSSHPGYFPAAPEPAALQDFDTPFERLSFYGYHQWQVAAPLQLIGGVAYDWLKFPENFRTAPISGADKTIDQVSPKAGIIWTPAGNTTVRFAYSRTLSGASLDQSCQLEPSQVAGFVQSFRSVIPESVVGGNAGARIDSTAVSLEQRFGTGTYVAVSGELLHSDLQRTVGAFDGLPDQFEWAIPSGLRQSLDYDEQSLLFTCNQLLADEWSLGARYGLSRAVLNENLVDVPDLPLNTIQPRQRFESTLHQVDLFATFNHPSGFFAGTEAHWRQQDNSGFTPGQPGDEFWQCDVRAGYRFARRRAAVTVAMLNVADQDYNLSPLNVYTELPHRRTLALKFQFSF